MSIYSTITSALKSSNKEEKAAAVVISQTDEPAVEDEFGIGKYIDGLAEFIAECKTPLTISIQGTWGTGKTSIMYLVKEKLAENINGNIVVPVWFNTWKFSQFNMSDQLPVSLISSLINKLNLKDAAVKEDAKAGLKILRRVCTIGSLAAAGLQSFGLAPLGDLLQESSKELKEELDKVSQGAPADAAESIEKLKDTFNACVQKCLEENGIKDNGRIVIFIDDLDRLNPGKAVELLEVLKLFLDCKNCVFVLAIDYDVVCRGVNIKYGSLADDKTEAEEKGKMFFDKIIQVPFKMPVARYKIENFVASCFRQMNFPLNENNKDELDVYVNLIKYSIGTNPRSMKRLFNAYQLLLKIARDSTKSPESKQLLFAVLCLQHCSEAIYNFMIRNLEKLEYPLFLSIVNCDYNSFIECINNSSIDNELTEGDFMEAQTFMEQLKNAIDLDNDKNIEKKEFDNFTNIMGFTAITNTTNVEEKTSGKKFYFKYNNEIYESYKRKGRNLGKLGFDLIHDAAVSWTKEDANRFREAFWEKGNTGWLCETIIFIEEVKNLKSDPDMIDSKTTIRRGVRKTVSIEGFTNRYFSYMDENDISFNEERARADEEYTIKLNDGGAFFVARYWGANDLRNLLETLAELFNFRPDVEEIQQ